MRRIPLNPTTQASLVPPPHRSSAIHFRLGRRIVTVRNSDRHIRFVRGLEHIAAELLHVRVNDVVGPVGLQVALSRSVDIASNSRGGGVRSVDTKRCGSRAHGPRLHGLPEQASAPGNRSPVARGPDAAGLAATMTRYRRSRGPRGCADTRVLESSLTKVMGRVQRFGFQTSESTCPRSMARCIGVEAGRPASDGPAKVGLVSLTTRTATKRQTLSWKMRPERKWADSEIERPLIDPAHG